MCHELRNPIHVLKSSVDMVLEENEELYGHLCMLAQQLLATGSQLASARQFALPVPAEVATRKQIASDLRFSICRMEGTVNDVLDFKKLDTGMFNAAPKPVRLAALIDDVCRQCRAFLLPDVEFGYRVAPDDAVVSIDSRRVFQIITNGLRSVYAPLHLCTWLPICRACACPGSEAACNVSLDLS